MNWYSVRKFLYGLGAGVLVDALAAVAGYLTTNNWESWALRALTAGVFTAIVAGLRRRFLPGWLGSQN